MNRMDKYILVNNTPPSLKGAYNYSCLSETWVARSHPVVSLHFMELTFDHLAIRSVGGRRNSTRFPFRLRLG